ncbi:hypothetical protein WN55_06074 [Dufourea novaeangliae]|uniref:Uncharacterized protein n=2 Tax=Dufourea novaeangliae TaxID=178035 RepID=A0A154P205_DUFNO|nr:hypothetical protein WN55_06074 [Dufourea novaeangliae]
MDGMATTSISSHVMLSSTHSLDTFKMSQLPRQVTTCNNNDNSHNTSCGNIIMVESSLNAKPTCSSVIVPLNSHNSGTIFPLSSKLKASQRSTKPMPKITVNASNLQRIQKAKPQTIQKKCLANDIDDDLGNILDIPIIFAKDDDNLNSIERNPCLSQVAAPIDVHDKGTPKLNSSTKVVLISNKQDKLQQTANKFVTPSTQTIICPNVAVQNLNHVILQTRPQNPTISKIKTTIPIQNRTNQPTIKYTKIILAKRNSQPLHQNDKSEQVIVTKTIDKINTPKVLSIDKTAQITSKQLARNDEKFIDDTLEIEDAIKMNIIERKYIPVQRIDLTSPTKQDNVKQISCETKADDENNYSQNTKIDDRMNLHM